MEIIGYFLAIIMGLVLGMLGGGGSILTVPILVYCFQIEAASATTYSLAIVGITSSLAALKYKNENLLDIKTAVLFAVPSTLGVLLSRLWLLPALPSTIFIGQITITNNELILIIFSCLILVISGFMLKTKEPSNTSQFHIKAKAEPTLHSNLNLKTTKTKTLKPKTMQLKQACYIGFEGMGVGIVTGIVGAGGGFMIVPALTLLAKIPLKKAIATSLLIISFKSIIGFLGDLSIGINLDWTFLTIILTLTLAGAFLGTKINKHVPTHLLRKWFAYLVLTMGVLILVKELMQ